MRAPVASPPFGPRNTTRRLFFTYRLLNRITGRWLWPEPRYSARGRLLVRLALPRTTRCPSRLAMSVSRIAPPRVLLRARIPGRLKPNQCVNPLLPRIACAAIPAVFGEDKRAGLAWTDRIRRSGETPWGAPLSRRCRRLSGARPPFPASIETEGGSLSGRSRKNESGCPDRRAGARRGKLRPPRPTRSAAPTHYTIPVVKEHPSGQQKKPWWLSNRPELFRLIWKVRFASLPDPLS